MAEFLVGQALVCVQLRVEKDIKQAQKLAQTLNHNMEVMIVPNHYKRIKHVKIIIAQVLTRCKRLL